MSKFVNFLREDSGATAIEYALIAASMGVTLIGAMPLLASAVTSTFGSLAAHIASGN